MRLILIAFLLLAGCNKAEPTPRMVQDIQSLAVYCEAFSDNNIFIVKPGSKAGEAVVVFAKAWSEMPIDEKISAANAIKKEWLSIHGPDARITVLSDTNEVILD